MSESSEAEVPPEKEAVPNGLLQKLRHANWAPGLRKHLVQEIALTPPPELECGGEGDFGGEDADGDGD